MFSEPSVVLADPNEMYNIAQWLPDNRRALITRDHLDANHLHVEYESIELFNPRTGKTEVYATRDWQPSFPPAWVPGLNAVVYQSNLVLSEAYYRNGKLSPNIDVGTNQLLISSGNPATVYPLEKAHLTFYPDLPDINLGVGSVFNLAVNSDGSRIAYWNEGGRTLYVRNISQGILDTLQPFSFDISQWNYRGPSNIFSAELAQLAWRPGTAQILFYSDPWSGNYTFLLDVASGQICEINLFGQQDPNVWPDNMVMSTRWSPNGRYLAVVHTKIPNNAPIDFSDLIVLDTVTGKVYQMDATKFSPPGMETIRRHYVVGIAWAPDNQHLAAVAQSDVYSAWTDSPRDINRLYLVDFLADQAVQVSPIELWSKPGEVNVIWSDDGSRLLIRCKEQSGNALCLLNVQK